MSRRLHASDLSIEQAPVTAAQLAALVARIADGTVSNSAARQVLDALWSKPGAAGVDALIDRLGLRQMNDDAALRSMAEAVIEANPGNVAQFRAGKDKAFNALVGQVMKASGGKANPAQVNALLKSLLT